MEKPSNQAGAVGDQSNDNGGDDDPPEAPTALLAAVAPLHFLALFAEDADIKAAVFRFFEVIAGLDRAIDKPAERAGEGWSIFIDAGITIW
jgi:hypothetical protein